MHTTSQIVELEQWVIGGLMLDQSQLPDLNLSFSDFTRSEHQRIYAGILKTAENGNYLEPLALSIESGVDLAYIDSLEKNTPSAVNLSVYAGKVKQEARRRAALKNLETTIGSLKKGEDVDETLSNLNSSLFEFEDNGASVLELNEVISSAMESSRDAMLNEGRIGVNTGLPEIDKRTGGIGGSRLWVVAARPSLGKTALTLQWAVHGVKHGYSVLFLSLEMTPDELGQRVLAQLHKENLTLIVQGEPLVYQNIESNPVKHVLDGQLWVDASSYTLPAIVSRITEFKRRHNIDYCVIDYLGLIKITSNRTRAEEIGNITKSLKRLTKKLGMPIVLISQLNRSSEIGEREPRLSDLRESGDIEQDCDVAIMLHKTETMINNPVSPYNIGILKNRVGRAGWIRNKFDFHGDTQEFKERAFEY